MSIPKILYVAGPMTGLPENNYPAFHAATAELEAAGFTVENPAITVLPDSAHYTEYLRAGLDQLLRAEGVAVLEDWWKSTGARWEVQTASILHLPVRSVSEWLLMKRHGRTTMDGFRPTRVIIDEVGRLEGF